MIEKSLCYVGTGSLFYAWFIVIIAEVLTVISSLQANGASTIKLQTIIDRLEHSIARDVNNKVSIEDNRNTFGDWKKRIINCARDMKLNLVTTFESYDFYPLKKNKS